MPITNETFLDKALSRGLPDSYAFEYQQPMIGQRPQKRQMREPAIHRRKPRDGGF